MLTMLRTTTLPRTLLRASSPRIVTRTQFTSQLCTLSSKRPQSIVIPIRRFHKTTIRQAVSTTRDTELEKKSAKEKLIARPELVSETSSTHPVFSEVGAPDPEKDADMSAGIKADLRTVKDTFDLSEVPRQAYYLGLAGVLPYLGTSIATVGAATELNRAHEEGTGFLLNAETAEQFLHILEPLQVGYGAVIISFLGAIHWGLEFANYGGPVGYRRYAIGVIAPAVAWPTILLPGEYALIAQFFAFNFLYYADTRAARRGEAPHWYGTYRFVLTFIVGAAIVVSLVARGQIHGEFTAKPAGPADRIKNMKENMAKQLEMEEEARRNMIVAEEEAAAEEENTSDEEDSEGGPEKKDGDNDKEKKD